jgi:hypothetical protein
MPAGFMHSGGERTARSAYGRKANVILGRLQTAVRNVRFGSKADGQAAPSKCTFGPQSRVRSTLSYTVVGAEVIGAAQDRHMVGTLAGKRGNARIRSANSTILADIPPATVGDFVRVVDLAGLELEHFSLYSDGLAQLPHSHWWSRMNTGGGPPFTGSLSSRDGRSTAAKPSRRYGTASLQELA